MTLIGCTGGIGSCKSTVCALLARKGAVIIDADALARRAIEPGGKAFGPVVERFTSAILDRDGAIDRGALAAIVFSSEGERRDLEALIHPVVRADIAERLAQLSDVEQVVVLDVALLVESGGRERYGLDGVLVVDAPEDLMIERLVAQRQMKPEEARRRIAAQAARAERLRAADFIILNIGTFAELEQMCERAWSWIETLAEDQRAEFAR